MANQDNALSVRTHLSRGPPAPGQEIERQRVVAPARVAGKSPQQITHPRVRVPPLLFETLWLLLFRRACGRVAGELLERPAKLIDLRLTYLDCRLS